MSASAPTVAPLRPEATAVDVARPIFVCGVGRSGTSLLQAMLAAHPEIALPPETHLFRRYVAAHGTRRRVTHGTVDSFLRTLAGDADLARAGIPSESLVAGEHDGEIDPARVYRRLLERWAQGEGKPRVGDKDPRILDMLSDLATAFPSGLVVHIVRDPRAVVHSRMNAAWSKDRPWWSHAIVAEEQLRRGRRLGRACFGERYLEVRYEELLARPREVLETICAHVDVPFDAAMLDFGGSARRLVSDDEVSWKKETFGPRLTDNDAKWRGELEPQQVAFIEAVCVEAFDGVGYERLGAAPGPVRGACLAAVRASGRAAYAVRRWREARR